MIVNHTLNPIYDNNSKILILGSFPSIISRQNNFYYANKNNRFWPILEYIFNTKLNSNEEKTNFLIKNNIALYDVVKKCIINNSNDSSIKVLEVNNIKEIIIKTNIKYIFLTGKKAYTLYKKYFKDINLEYYYLPSPSSANAIYTLDKLIKEYNIIKEKLEA